MNPGILIAIICGIIILVLVFSLTIYILVSSNSNTETDNSDLPGIPEKVSLSYKPPSFNAVNLPNNQREDKHVYRRRGLYW